MNHIFLETNIVIDFLADRKPFSLFAAKLFNFSILGKTKLYVSAVSYNNIYYILRQSYSRTVTMNLLDQLCEITEVAGVTKTIIKKSCKWDFKDFEDAIQYYCALSLPNVDFIVTRDAKDFKKSILSIRTQEEAVRLAENAAG